MIRVRNQGLWFQKKLFTGWSWIALVGTDIPTGWRWGLWAATFSSSVPMKFQINPEGLGRDKFVPIMVHPEGWSIAAPAQSDTFVIPQGDRPFHVTENANENIVIQPVVLVTGNSLSGLPLGCELVARAISPEEYARKQMGDV